MKSNLKVTPTVTLEYRAPNSDYWVHHSAHDGLKQANAVRKTCVDDERKRGARTVWRVVEWTGRVASVLPSFG